MDENACMKAVALLAAFVMMGMVQANDIPTKALAPIAENARLRPKGEIAGATRTAYAADAAKTDLMFFYDTEAFTAPAGADGILEMAQMMTDEGIVANFATVGRLAEALEEWKRPDVIAAMMPHEVSSHTYGHSWHPVHMELADALNYGEAYRRIRAEEAHGLDVLRRIFPNGRPILAYVPGGDNEPYVAQYVYRDLGVPVACAVSFMPVDSGDLAYCGLLQIPYVYSFDKFLPGRAPCEPEKIADKLAKARRAVIYCHPQRNVEKQYWDVLNFKGRNPPAGQPYVQSEKWPAAERAQYLSDIRRTVRHLKADPRFNITTLEALVKSLPPRETMKRTDVAFLRRELAASFGPVDAYGWCLCDVFRGIQRFLCGAETYSPANEFGFLERPVGIASAVDVSAADLRTAAARLPASGFLPSSIDVGGVKLGPKDFLMAALEALATGAERVHLEPAGDQLGLFDRVPALATKRYNCRDSWPIYDPAMKGERAAELARLQLWTLRKVK